MFMYGSFHITRAVQDVVYRLDLSQQSNEYEIVDFIVDRFKRVTGLGTRKKRNVVTPSVDHTDYVEGVPINVEF